MSLSMTFFSSSFHTAPVCIEFMVEDKEMKTVEQKAGRKAQAIVGGK